MIVEFQEELELPFAPYKAYLIGNNSQVLKIGEKALANFAGRDSHAVKRLGVDHALDGQSQTGVPISRCAKA